MMLIITSIPLYSIKKEAKAFSLPVSNPVLHENGKAKWDCVWFGRYYKNRYQKKTLYPIKWRVLSVENDEVLVVSDQNLDIKQYNNVNTYPTWKNSGIRSWLNGYSANKNAEDTDYTKKNFIDTAFTEEEKSQIADSQIETADNPIYGTSGGNSSTDKLFLLSYEEITNPAYGFRDNTVGRTTTRVSRHTDYAAGGGIIENTNVSSTRVGDCQESIYWWLRSPGQYTTQAMWVNDRGEIVVHGTSHTDTIFGVRPAMWLKRSAFEKGLCKYAGYVETDDDEYQLNASETKGEIYSPRIDLTYKKAEWDCLWFGKYWQEDTNGDGKTDKNDAKQPILWRILEKEGTDVFLVSDKVLDIRSYHETKTDVTWEGSTLRSWLNGYAATANTCGTDYQKDNFLQNAFSAKEQEAIKTTTLTNKSADMNVSGGNKTKDKVFCLSGDDIRETGYGFGYDGLRQACETDYVVEKDSKYFPDKGMEGRQKWWLRTTGNEASKATYINVFGNTINVWREFPCLFVNDFCAIRPALHLDLSKMDASLYTYAGTVSRCSGGKNVELSEPESVTLATPRPVMSFSPQTPAPSQNTVTPSPTSSATPPSASSSPSATPSPTPTPSATPSPATASPSPSVTPSIKPTALPKETLSPTKIPQSSAAPEQTPSTVKPPLQDSNTGDSGTNDSNKGDNNGGNQTSIPDIITSPQPNIPTAPASTPNPTENTGNEQEKSDFSFDVKHLTWNTCLSVKLNKNNVPVLRWKKNPYAGGYQLYRSKKKNAGYKIVKNTSTAEVLSYVDKKAAANTRYYYKLSSYRKINGTMKAGTFSKVFSIKTLNMKKPKISAKKGVTASKIPYIELKVKRYSGINLTIYYKVGKGVYRRLKLSSSSIKKNHGKFKIQCSGKDKKTYYFKVKTKIRRKKKTYYSKYSNEVKVKR